jgi:hypothetical protein
VRRIILAVSLLGLVAAVTAGTVVGGSSVATAGIAATPAKPTCSKVTGTLLAPSAKITVSDCTGGLGTGDITTKFNGIAGFTGTATWYKPGKKSVVQGTTKVDKVRITPHVPSRCSSTASEYDLSGTVSADTTHKIPVGSKIAGDVCVGNTLSLVKGTVIKL